MYQYPVV